MFTVLYISLTVKIETSVHVLYNNKSSVKHFVVLLITINNCSVLESLGQTIYPNAVTELTATPITWPPAADGSQVIFVSWNAPNNTQNVTLIAYSIYGWYLGYYGNWYFSATVNPNSTNYTITQLPACAVFYITISPMSACCYGPSSSVSVYSFLNCMHIRQYIKLFI